MDSRAARGRPSPLRVHFLRTSDGGTGQARKETKPRQFSGRHCSEPTFCSVARSRPCNQRTGLSTSIRSVSELHKQPASFVSILMGDGAPADVTAYATHSLSISAQQPCLLGSNPMGLGWGLGGRRYERQTLCSHSSVSSSLSSYSFYKTTPGGLAHSSAVLILELLGGAQHISCPSFH